MCEIRQFLRRKEGGDREKNSGGTILLKRQQNSYSIEQERESQEAIFGVN